MSITSRLLRFSPLLLLLAWAILHYVASAQANWSYDDDFSYAGIVENFLRTGRVQYSDWVSMTLILQVWLGAAITKITGFSYDNLRYLTIAMHASASLAIYACASELRVREGLALSMSLLFLAHPLIVLLSLYFATDLPFLGILLWSVYFFLRTLRSESTLDLALALLLAVAAFLIRDLAIILAPAYALSLLLQKNKQRAWLLKSCAALAILIIAYLSWRSWLLQTQGTPALIDLGRQRLVDTWTHPLKLISSYSRNLVYTSCYLGLSLLPLSLSLAAQLLRRSTTWQRISVLGYATISSLALWLTPRAFEHMSEQLLNPFVPYASLASVHVLLNEALPAPSTLLVATLCVIGLCSTSILLLGLLRYAGSLKQSLSSLREDPRLTFLVVSIVLYCALIFSLWIIHRYYMVLFALLLLCASLLVRKREIPFTAIGRNLGFAALACIVFLGLANGHDFMAHQSAMAQVYNVAEQRFGLNEHNMDGGFAYNSRRAFNYKYQVQPQLNWWWVERDDYVVSEAPAQGMSELYRANYRRFLPWGAVGSIILQKNDAHIVRLRPDAEKGLAN